MFSFAKEFSSKIAPLTFISLLFSSLAFSQSAKQSGLGSWIFLVGQFRIHEKWSIHAETQFRDYGIASETEQLLLRGGVNYHYTPKVMLTAGYAHVTSYPDDDEFLQPPSIAENRLWQQVLLRSNVGRFNIDHRYRLEQRWIESNNNKRYPDRMRYQLKITIPINQKEIKSSTLFISVYDEAFIHFSSSPFDRNRAFGALGYQFSKSANVQFGYMAQTVNIKTKHYLQAGLNYNIDLRKDH